MHTPLRITHNAVTSVQWQEQHKYGLWKWIWIIYLTHQVRIIEGRLWHYCVAASELGPSSSVAFHDNNSNYLPTHPQSQPVRRHAVGLACKLMARVWHQTIQLWVTVLYTVGERLVNCCVPSASDDIFIVMSPVVPMPTGRFSIYLLTLLVTLN